MLRISTCLPRQDQLANAYSEHTKMMLDQIRKVMEGDGQLQIMQDTSFHVGTHEKHREIVKANATILSLRSPYFRELCFGPLLSDVNPKIVCIEVETFKKVMRYCHGTPDCLFIEDCEEAWSVRHAAQIFQMADLLRLCEKFLYDHLDFKSALGIFQAARLHEAYTIKLSCLLVMKNRYKFILGSDDIKTLGVGDMIDLVSFYKDLAIPGLILSSLHVWGSSMDGGIEKFKKIFRTQLFPLIDWKSLENEMMTRLVGSNWMTQDQEHTAMAEILSLSRPPALPLAPAKVNLTVKFICTKKSHLFMRACSCQETKISFRQIILTMVSNSTQSLTLASDRGDDLFSLERGVRFLRRGIAVEKGSVLCSTIPREDIDLEITSAMGDAAAAVEINDLHVAAVSFSGTNFIILDFVSSEFVASCKGEEEWLIGVALSPIVRADLEAGVLPRRSQLTVSATKTSRADSSNSDYKIGVVKWESFLRGSSVLSGDTTATGQQSTEGRTRTDQKTSTNCNEKIPIIMSII